MNTQTKQTMMHRIFLSAVLGAVLFFAPGLLPAQEKTYYNRNEKQKIPPNVLVPQISRARINNDLQKQYRILTEKLRHDLSPAGDTGKKEEEESGKYITRLDVLSACNIFHDIAVHPDLEEVTLLSKVYFEQLYNAAVPLYAPAEAMDKARLAGNSQAYMVARARYEKALEYFKDAYKNRKGIRLSKTDLKEIKEQNRKRRIDEYIKKSRTQSAEAQ